MFLLLREKASWGSFIYMKGLRSHRNSSGKEPYLVWGVGEDGESMSLQKEPYIDTKKEWNWAKENVQVLKCVWTSKQSRACIRRQERTQMRFQSWHVEHQEKELVDRYISPELELFGHKETLLWPQNVCHSDPVWFHVIFPTPCGHCGLRAWSCVPSESRTLQGKNTEW